MSDPDVLRILTFGWGTAAAIFWVRNNVLRVLIPTGLFVVGLVSIFAPESLRELWSMVRELLLDKAAAAVLGVIAVVSGWIAAQGAIGALKTTALDTAANAFLTLREKYHSDEMRAAIKLLFDFAISTKEAAGSVWQEKLRVADFRALGQLLRPARDRKSTDELSELKSAARMVTAYFDDVAFLVEHKIIKGKIVENFLNVPGLNIFYEVCVPLLALDNEHSPSIAYAHALRRHKKQQGSGMKRYPGDSPKQPAALSPIASQTAVAQGGRLTSLSRPRSQASARHAQVP